MQCPHCHFDVAPNPFCSNCGSPLHVDVEAMHYDDIDPHSRPTRQSPAATPQPRPRFAFQQQAGPVRVDYDDYHVEVFDAPPDDVGHVPVDDGHSPDGAVEELLSILQASSEGVAPHEHIQHVEDHKPDANHLALGEPDSSFEALEDDFEDSLSGDVAEGDNFDDAAFLDSDPFAEEFFEDDGFAFGDDDSGPIPMSAPRLDATPHHDDILDDDDDDDELFFSHKPRRRRRRQRVPGGITAQWRDQLAHLPRKPMLIGAALVLLLGLSWVMFGSGPPNPEANSNMASSPPTSTKSSSNAAQSEAHPPNVLIGLEEASASDDQRLIRIADEPAEDGDTETQADDPDDPGTHALFPKSALLASTKPLSTRPRKLNRPCVLRGGPSSRFSALVPSLKPGSELTVLAMSSENWRTASHKGQHGWVNNCNPAKSSCTMHEGPGKHFRTLTKARKQEKPRKGVVSSNRWRYVKYGDLYGWTGPACWK